jgi:uncharacterized protein (TIGR00369 family)
MTTSVTEDDAPPDGFVSLIGDDVGFNALIGPHYVRVVDGVAAIGFRVGRRHLNPSGNCHGGALAALADYQAVTVRHIAGLGACVTPTVTLAIDFIAPVQLGAWVELHSRLLRRTRTLLFSEGHLIVGDAVVARVDAIFKIGPTRPDFVNLTSADGVSAL